MSIAIYAGSFDPITNGHLDIIKSGSEIFDKVIVAVSSNINKSAFLPVDIRIRLIEESLKDLPNIQVDSYNCLTVDYAKKTGADVLLRGLRNQQDFEYEFQISQVNNSLDSSLKTVFLITKPEYSYISSSMVREVFSYGGDITKYVPSAVSDYLKNNI